MEIKAIHQQFHKVLYNFILHRVNNQKDAEDILQEVFIKIFKGLASLGNEEKIKSWIFTITRNSITDYYRRKGQHTTVGLTEQLIEETYETLVVDTTIGLDKCLKGFIEQLPEEYRTIIIDSELKGIRQKELAEKYNLQYPTIRSRVQRGRMRLKEMILQCCKVETDSRGNILEASSQKACNGTCETYD